MQIEIINLATSGMIFLDFVFRRYEQKSNFVEKNGLLPHKNFLLKGDGHFKRDRKKIIPV